MRSRAKKKKKNQDDKGIGQTIGDNGDVQPGEKKNVRRE